MNVENLKSMKKAELHLHLDGSLRTATVREIALSEGIISGKTTLDEVDKMLKVDEETKSLLDYLKRFDLPVKVMQTKANIERVSYELAEDLAKENYIYAEIRFAPHLHTAKGLKLEEIVEAVLKGIHRAEEKYDIKIGIILCMMRHMDAEKGFDIVELAEEYREMGVVGIDLAGDEKNFPPVLFKEVFDFAKSKKLNITIHAGESAGAKSVEEAVKMGAMRIGHGIRAIEDEQVVQQLIDLGIPMEVCPISNLQTKVYEDFSKYPIAELIKKGVIVSLNTDNRKVSDTNLIKEMELLGERFGITEEEFRQMVRNSILKSFQNEEEKERLIKKL